MTRFLLLAALPLALAQVLDGITTMRVINAGGREAVALTARFLKALGLHRGLWLTKSISAAVQVVATAALWFLIGEWAGAVLAMAFLGYLGIRVIRHNLRERAKQRRRT